MSRTYNTMPYTLQRYHRSGVPVPDDYNLLFRSRRRWSSRWVPPVEVEDRRIEEWAKLDRFRVRYPEIYGGCWPNRGEWAGYENRRYRSHVKTRIAQARYDDIEPPRNSAKWLIW